MFSGIFTHDPPPSRRGGRDATRIESEAADPDTSSVPVAAGEAWVRRLLGLGLLFALPVAGWLYLQLPPSPDQWQLDYTGWLVTRGAAPYVDIRDGNWPGAHWLHALSVALSGPGFGGWRGFDLLLLIPGLAGGAFFASRIGGRSAGLWWALVYPLLYATVGPWFAGQRDIISTHFGVAALAASWLVVDGRSRGFAAPAGLALTAAALVKPTFAMMALIVPVLAYARYLVGAVTLRRAVLGVSYVALSSVLFLLAAVLVLWLEGATWASFQEHAIDAILIRVPNVSLPVSGRLEFALQEVVTSWHWLAAGALIATVVDLRSPEPDRRVALLAGWLVVLVGLFSHVVQGHSLLYYLAPVFVGLSILVCGALGLATTRAARPPQAIRFLAIAGMAIALAGTAAKFRTAYADLVPVLVGDVPWSEWEQGFPAGDGLNADEARRLASVIAPLIPEDGTLLVWGRANVLNLLVERPQPTGFYHKPHFQRSYLPDSLRQRWTGEIESDLTTSPPAVALVDRDTEYIDTPLRQFLEGLLAERFRAVCRVGTSTLYVANHITPPTECLP